MSAKTSPNDRNSLNTMPEIDPFLAAKVVKEYLLPMFKKRKLKSDKKK